MYEQELNRLLWQTARNTTLTQDVTITFCVVMIFRGFILARSESTHILR